MNNGQPSPFVKLCMIIGITLVASIYLFATGSASTAIIIMVIMGGYGVGSYLFETHNDKKAEKLKNDIENGTLYAGDEWQEKYLRYKMSEPFAKIIGSDMKHDMQKHYHTTKHLVGIILAGFLILCDLCLFAIHIAAGIGGLLLFCGLMYLAVTSYGGRPVKKFYKRTDVDFQAVNDSYMSGKMVAYQCNGINIGSKYLVAFNETKVIALELHDVSDITKEILREKEYVNSVYTGEKTRLFAVVNGDTKIEMRDEFQLELAIEEFHRAVGR